MYRYDVRLTPEKPAEEFRLRYRYLDLRRSALSGNLQKRSKVAHLIRTALHDHGLSASPLLAHGFADV